MEKRKSAAQPTLKNKTLTSSLSSPAAFHVLITDPLATEGLSLLTHNSQFQIHLKVGAPLSEWEDLLQDCHCWLVRSETKVTETLIAKAPHLKVIGRAGVGIDNIDVEAASRRGILVMNVPGANTLAAAEHTFGLILALSRNIPQAHRDLSSGKWERKRLMGSELAGKTLGIVGLGRIGREISKRAQAFNMRVLAYDPYVPLEYASSLGVEVTSLENLLNTSDYITLHTSLNEKTRHLISEKTLRQVKSGARLINCARGELVDEKALLKALEEGKLRGAALDVFSQEPLPPTSALVKASQSLNLILTPHLGASTEEAQLKVASELARNIVDYFQQGILRNAVNLPGFDAEILEKLGDHLSLAERLGRFSAQVLSGGLLEVRIQCDGTYEPNQRRPLAVAALKGLLSSIMDESGISWVNAPLLAQERGIKLLETATPASSDGFFKLLTVSVKTETGQQTVSGTVQPNGELRLVRFGSLTVDVVLQGKMLVLTNQDRPGVIGLIGTLLGKYKINIADMRVGRKSAKGEAAMVISVDEDVPAEVLKEIKSIAGIQAIHWVKL
ncbi:MAG: phosphoglycerate dehydrogenase [Elusimicrobia bacterium]|nr:phosphoglycerate dehydrogenase [Elusimicrobiota bacterium]